MRKKLIEVALPLDAVNAASAREKSIRHGHPSTLHLWWARRPLAAARAVIFAQMVDDPSEYVDVLLSEIPVRGEGRAAGCGGSEGGAKLSRGANFRCVMSGTPIAGDYINAFKQTESRGNIGAISTGWETFLEAVITEGFTITGTWPVRTELESRSIAIGTNALASSIVLVCRPRPADELGVRLQSRCKLGGGPLRREKIDPPVVDGRERASRPCASTAAARRRSRPPAARTTPAHAPRPPTTAPRCPAACCSGQRRRG